MSIPDGLELTAFDDTFYADPYAVYQRLREAEPVHRDSASFYGESWTVSSHELAQALLTDKRLSVNPAAVGLRRDPRADNAVTLRAPDMMNLDEPDHARLRGLVHKAFAPHLVEQFAPRIREIVNDQILVLQRLAVDGPVDVVEHFSKPIPTIVIAEFIGVDSQHHLDFKHWTDTLLKQGYPMPTEAQWEEIVRADQSLRLYLQKVIEERRRAPDDDLISRMVKAQVDNEVLSDQEVQDMCSLLIGAGNFTTTDLISNSIHAVIKHGIEPAQAGVAVTEVLRHDSPVLSVQRFATEDMEVAGQQIGKGSVINILLGAANHDPAQFVKADGFDIDRQNARHLSFGRGIHHCLGAPLAKLETELAVEAFFAAFPNANIESGRRRKQMGFRGFSELGLAMGG